MRKFVVIATVAGLAIGAAAPTAREKREAREMARLDKALAGYTAGASQSCVDPRALKNAEAFGEKTLTFRQGKIVWRNDTKGGCDALGDDRLVTEQFGSRMCAGDTARTVDISGDETGSCVLGDFVPYRKSE